MTVKTNKLILRDDATGFTHDIMQDIQNAVADKASYKFNAGATNTSNIVVADNNNLSILGAISIIGTFKRLDLADEGLYIGKEYGGSAKEYLVMCNNAGAVRIQLFSTNNTNYIQAITATGLVEDLNWHTIAVTHDGSLSPSGFKIYIDGVSIPYTGSTIGSYTGMVNLTSDLRINDNGLCYPNQISRCVLLNYALPAEKIQRYSDGAKLDWEDIGGGLKNTVAADQDFSSNTGYWSLDVNVLITGGQVTFTGATDTSGIKRNGFIIGNKYRLTVTVGNVTGALWLHNTWATVTKKIVNGVEVAASNTLTANATNTVEFTCLSTYIGILANGTTTATLDNMFLYQLGAVLDLEPEGIVAQTLTGTPTNLWLDSSGNGLHGAATGALPTNCKREIVNSKLTVAVNATTTGNHLALTGITLSPGTWRISAIASPGGSGTGQSYFEATIATGVTSGVPDGVTFGYDFVNFGIYVAQTCIPTLTVPHKTVTIYTPTTFYVTGRVEYTGGTPSWRGSIEAIRIA